MYSICIYIYVIYIYDMGIYVIYIYVYIHIHVFYSFCMAYELNRGPRNNFMVSKVVQRVCC